MRISNEQIKAISKEILSLSLGDIKPNINVLNRKLFTLEMRYNNLKEKREVKKEKKLSTRKIDYMVKTLGHKIGVLREEILNYQESVKWFEAKGRQPFGYYFCLDQARYNPNSIRKYLTKHGVKECVL